MKYQKKLQFIFLIPAVIIFYGQGLVHPVFHAHPEVCSRGSQYQYSAPEIKNEFTQSLFLKHTCPICSSIANKSTFALNLETQVIRRVFPIYSRSCESFSFNFRSKVFSRAPPAV